jgi:hypothetical protein
MAQLDTPSTDLTRLITLLCWSLLLVRTYVHPTLTIAIDSFNTLSALYNAAQLTFCPGLLDTICMVAPPTFVWFKSLSSSIPIKRWGIYVLVLKKPGCTPGIYIGSGTDSRNGLSGRLYGHLRGDACPFHVDKAKRDGFTITHMAVLVSCPIPAPADRPRIRVLLLLLEAAFTCIFWSLRRRDQPYGCEHLAPWSLDLYSWDGLCSHSPITESAEVRKGDLQFSHEQLNQMATITEDKERTYQSNYQKALRTNPTPQYTASVKAKNAKHYPATKRRQQDAILNKTFHCSVCDVSCRDAASLARHQTTKRHLKKTVMGDSDYVCELCDISFRYKSDFEAHERTKRHIKNIEENES